MSSFKCIFCGRDKRRERCGYCGQVPWKGLVGKLMEGYLKFGTRQGLWFWLEDNE